MKKLTILLVFLSLNLYAGEDLYLFKAKIVMKNKTSFTATFMCWSSEIPDKMPYKSICTDKGIQQLLNHRNLEKIYNKKGEIVTGNRVQLYKNLYSINHTDDIQATKFGFCDTTDYLEIDARDILYTVYIRSTLETDDHTPWIEFESWGVPIYHLDKTTVTDLRKNKVCAIYHKYYVYPNDNGDLGTNFCFYTTNKKMTNSKIEKFIKKQKYKFKKLRDNKTYLQTIKTELAKQRIYLFEYDESGC